MKKLLIVMLFVLLVVIPVACAKAPAPAPTPTPSPVPVPAPAPPPGFSVPGLPGKGAVSDAGNVPSAADERMIIRQGNMSLVVTDVIAALDRIAQMAVGFGGYVVSSQISGEEQDRRGTISIRVPDESFDQSLADFRKLAVRVRSESTSSQDVTEEYTDLTARLKNAQATENQYLALLEQAKNVEDILRIYDSLSRVRSEIEQIKGRMQYLERTSSMSLITVRLEPEASGKPLARAGWNAIEVLKSAVRGLITAGQVLASIVIWLLIFIPVWGTVLGIIIWRRHKKRAAA